MNTDLLADCLAGDMQSWDLLLGQLYPKAMTIARGILRDKELAGDVVQNSLLKVYNQLKSLRELAAFPGWFKTVVTNEAYLALRVYRKEIDGEWTGGVDYADPAEQATLKTEVIRAVSQIPVNFQQAVILCDLLELSIEEAARQCTVPSGTLKSRLSRGRELVRRNLAEFRSGDKERCKLDRPIEELLYDYLEGRLDAPEEAKVSEMLAQDSTLQQRLKEQREFLKLLHSMMGKLSLSAAEIAVKMQAVYDAVDDYEYVAEDTVVMNNRPQTLVQNHWFKKPNLRRVESEVPGMGKLTVIIRGLEVLGQYPQQDKVVRTRVTEEFLNQYGADFATTLKDITTNNTTTLLGSEVVGGRTCYHLKLQKPAPGGQGQLLTHLWLDKLTWMPLLTEEYNSDGNLIKRTVVRNLIVNAGIPDSTFQFDPALQVEDVDAGAAKPPRKVTLKEARRQLSFEPLLLDDSNLVLNECNLMEVKSFPVLMTQYHLPGEPVAQVTVTQGQVYHTNLAPGMETQKVTVGQVTGEYVAMNVLNFQGLISFQVGDIYLNVGGNGSKEELIAWAESLTSLNNRA